MNSISIKFPLAAPVSMSTPHPTLQLPQYDSGGPVASHPVTLNPPATLRDPKMLISFFAAEQDWCSRAVYT